jgi:hypothetical protein
MKRIPLVLCLLALALSGFGISFAIAPFNVYGDGANVEVTDMEKSSSNFVRQFLAKERFEKDIRIIDVAENKDVPSFIVKTEREAEELCIYLGCDYLLFGYVKKTALYYDAELRIYGFEKKEVVGTVYDRHETNDFLFMMKEVSAKTANKIAEVTNTQKEETVIPRKFFLSNHLGIYNSLGYWIPVTWWDALTGIVTVESGIKIVRIPPLYTYRNVVAVSVRPGFTISYALALNKPEMVENYFHSFLFEFPVDLCFGFFDETFLAYVGSGAGLQFDLIFQNPPYKDPKVGASIALSMPLSIGLELFPEKSKLITIGLDNTFDFTFYDRIFVDYRITFFLLLKFAELEEDL